MGVYVLNPNASRSIYSAQVISEVHQDSLLAPTRLPELLYLVSRPRIVIVIRRAMKDVTLGNGTRLSRGTLS